MAHTFGTSVLARTSAATDPITRSVTLNSADTVLVLVLKVNGATDRTGGAPTYNGVAGTQVDTTQKAVTTPEASVEMWYWTAPTITTADIVIPNTGAATIFSSAHTGRAGAGMTSAFDDDAGGNATSANPTTGNIVPTVNGAIIFAACASGAQTFAPSARTGTSIYETDDGAHGGAAQYLLQAVAGTQAMSWTQSSDDWGAVGVAFKEIVPPLTHSTSESAKADDGGHVELRGLGNPVKILDVLTALLVVGEVLTASPSESLKISDAVFATLNPEQTVITESVKVSDAPLITINPELAGLAESAKISEQLTVLLASFDATASESLKVVDQTPVGRLDPIQSIFSESLKVVDSVLGLTLDPEEAIPTENLKIVDSVLLTLDPEETAPSEVLKVSDTAVGSLDPEQASFSEALKVVDVVAPSLDPEEASFIESLKVSDDLSVIRLTGQIDAAPTQESLKVVDTALVTLNPEQATPVESVKTDDGGFVELRGLGNPIKIIDGPVVAVLATTGDNLTASPSESLKVVDTVTAAIGLVASLTESLKVVDSGEAELIRDETIRISEFLDAILGGALTAGPSESLKVADVVLGLTLNPEQVNTSESLKVADTVSATIGLIQSLSEALKVVDAPAVLLNPEQATPSESLKVSDEASAIRVDEGTLVGTPPVEPVKVADSVSVTLNPESANTSETLKVSDVLSVAIELIASLNEALKAVDTASVAVQLATQLTESLIVSDGTPVGRLNPIQVIVIDSLKVADEQPVGTPGSTLTAQPIEPLKIADTPITSLNPEETAPTESLKVVDTVVVAVQLAVDVNESCIISDGTPSGRLNPLQITISESFKVVDTLTTGTVLPASASESLKVVDTVAAQVDPEERALSESIGVSDLVIVVLTPEETALSEGVGVSDEVQASLAVLIVNLTEPLTVFDQIPRFGGPGQIETVGLYQTSLSTVTGSYVTSIEVVGESV